MWCGIAHLYFSHRWISCDRRLALARLLWSTVAVGRMCGTTRRGRGFMWVAGAEKAHGYHSFVCGSLWPRYSKPAQTARADWFWSGSVAGASRPLAVSSWFRLRGGFHTHRGRSSQVLVPPLKKPTTTTQGNNNTDTIQHTGHCTSLCCLLLASGRRRGMQLHWSVVCDLLITNTTPPHCEGHPPYVLPSCAAEATATTASCDISGILRTKTGGARARRPRCSATHATDNRKAFCPAHTRAATTSASRRTRAPQHATRVAVSPPPQRQPQSQDRSTRARAAPRHSHRNAAPARFAPPPATAPPVSDLLTYERRRTTTKRCCAPARTQRRRRRSMGHSDTGRPPRQRGCRLVPPMRARLITPPHGRHHKAPPPPCALATTSADRGNPGLFFVCGERRLKARPKASPAWRLGAGRSAETPPKGPVAG